MTASACPQDLDAQVAAYADRVGLFDGDLGDPDEWGQVIGVIVRRFHVDTVTAIEILGRVTS